MSVLNILEEKLAETKKQGRFREFLNLERGVQDKPWATSHGHHGERRLNVWCSNDYLAMSHHPKVLLATTDAVNRVGLAPAAPAAFPAPRSTTASWKRCWPAPTAKSRRCCSPPVSAPTTPPYPPCATPFPI
ncbi:hypothetical protein [Serratia bockelmannii]|uniref:hypothetical protein n=1 Tax=Serratia bockelmannii TaxID=2703793 RepID=UPI003F6D671B